MNARTPSPPARLVVSDLVLDGAEPLDVAVDAGQVLAVSGWASSQLLWAIAGLQPVTAGHVLVDGRPINDHAQALAAGVALIPRGSGLSTLLTAFENVLLPLTDRPAASSSGDDHRTTAELALTAVGLAESGNHLIEELSGGQQQRVAIARAVAARPRLLLADQATTDLDPGNRLLVIGILRDLAERGTAVLLTSDDPAVTGSCDTIIDLAASARSTR